jgi:hypothetical protein
MLILKGLFFRQRFWQKGCYEENARPKEDA